MSFSEPCSEEYAGRPKGLLQAHSAVDVVVRQQHRAVSVGVHRRLPELRGHPQDGGVGEREVLADRADGDVVAGDGHGLALADVEGGGGHGFVGKLLAPWKLSALRQRQDGHGSVLAVALGHEHLAGAERGEPVARLDAGGGERDVFRVLEDHRLRVQRLQRGGVLLAQAGGQAREHDHQQRNQRHGACDQPEAPLG